MLGNLDLMKYLSVILIFLNIAHVYLLGLPENNDLYYYSLLLNLL